MSTVNIPPVKVFTESFIIENLALIGIKKKEFSRTWTSDLLFVCLLLCCSLLLTIVLLSSY